VVIGIKLDIDFCRATLC